ncbi:lysophospholipase [Leptospira interrogans serovar Linhai str. 56609]|uniref:alpha/beta hydrolase n=1 Tax=Leptospira interrogans TaxID=173 RepID=UPI0002BA9BF9|nr:alpha/beta fold hydrolase [Leptospira interrogans]AJR14955.1 lysophospholipase [Leptospira interrogans serovar Linhai str. 56609]EMN67402.1 alpha/beta hydrolase family protein [Leptospira interrogans serovar Grippotyphosa str. UI 08434]QOI34902.1 alpha/beta hydrolase [Leptospira interrogans serovar Icterohaemorrhagiae]UMQ57196.1 alpha/beta hydrolase [Leptospira interrogans]UNE65944.1 alpha/beta hydrolase [Leptospira interrogans]
MKKLNFPFHYFSKTILFFFLLIHLESCASLFYQPTNQKYWKPDTFGFQYKEEIFKTFDGESIRYWRIFPKDSKPKGVVLQFHGNGENRTSHFMSLVWMVNYGYELVTLDYRGYLDSTGVPERETIHKDSVDFISRELEYSNKRNIPIIIYGQSLGGAIALRATSELKNKSGILLVVADGTFASYRKVFRQIVRKILFFPIDWIAGIFMSDSLSPHETISALSAIPLLVIHGTEDEIVPYQNGIELFGLAGEPKWFWEVRGGGHVNWMNLGASKDSKNFLSFLDNLIEKSKLNPDFFRQIF